MRLTNLRIECLLKMHITHIIPQAIKCNDSAADEQAQRPADKTTTVSPINEHMDAQVYCLHINHESEPATTFIPQKPQILAPILIANKSLS